MRNQLRYALEDMVAHKWRYFNIFIQISATLILMAYSGLAILEEHNYINKLAAVMARQAEESYMHSDRSSSEQWDEVINNENLEDSLRRLSGLYNFIRSNFQTYTACAGFGLYLSGSKPDSSFAVDRGMDGSRFALLKIDDRFQDRFDLQAYKGRLFSEEDFSSADTEIPLIIGFDLKQYYDPGALIIDAVGQPYRVIGILDRSYFFLNPWEGRTVYQLDRMFIAPFQPVKFDTTCYYAAIFSTYIITDDQAALRSIQEKSTALRLFALESRSFTEQMEFLLEDAREGIITLGLIISVILFFALTGFISSLMQFIDRYTREFAIHLLCGAQMRSIIRRILIQVFTVVLLSNLAVAAMYKVSLPTLIALFSSLLIALIAVIYPIVVLSRTQINTILKRSR